MAIDKTKLTGLSPVYPLNIPQYEDFVGQEENQNHIEKINSVIQSLHAIGKLTNKTVAQWNTVMKWVLDEGLEEITTQVTNEKLDVALNTGLKKLTETVASEKIDELLSSGQLETIVEESLTEINQVVEGKLEGFNAQLAEMPNYSHTFRIAKTPKLIAHRGLSGLAPENTLPSFELAGKHGYWGCECDIHITNDGIWVINHDYDIDHMTNGSGFIWDLTLAQIQSYTVDNGNNVNIHPNLKLPLLTDYLKVCDKYNMVPIIEIKSFKTNADLDKLIQILKDSGHETNCLLLSSDYKHFDYIRSVNSKLVLSFLADINETSINRVKGWGNCGMSVWNPSEANLKLVHSNGLQINVWTIDKYLEAKKFIDMGVDFLSTNIIAEVFK